MIILIEIFDLKKSIRSSLFKEGRSNRPNNTCIKQFGPEEQIISILIKTKENSLFICNKTFCCHGNMLRYCRCWSSHLKVIKTLRNNNISKTCIKTTKYKFATMKTRSMQLML